MKHFFSICLIALAGIASHSCKKGENDPFLSLHSRKARVVGEWKVTHYSLSWYQEHGDDFNQSTETLDNGTLTTVGTFTDDGNVIGPVVNSNKVEWSFEFRRDGSYTEVQTVGGLRKTQKGTWTFMKRNKTNKLRNKEAILLTVSEEGNQFQSGYTSTKLSGDVMTIDMLKNKRMVWKNESESIGSNSLYRSKEEVTLEQN
jgi:hypothetical protein